MTDSLNLSAFAYNDNIEKQFRALLKYFLALVFVTTLLISYQSFQDHNSWRLGDWLINYQGGMVRRGLLGELVYRTSQLIQLSPGFLVFLLQSFFYTVFLGFSYRLLLGQHKLLPYILLIFSPFIFTFQIYDFQGGYRKEIIFFASLILLIEAAF